MSSPIIEELIEALISYLSWTVCHSTFENTIRAYSGITCIYHFERKGGKRSESDFYIQSSLPPFSMHSFIRSVVRFIELNRSNNFPFEFVNLMVGPLFLCTYFSIPFYIGRIEQWISHFRFFLKKRVWQIHFCSIFWDDIFLSNKFYAT